MIAGHTPDVSSFLANYFLQMGFKVTVYCAPLTLHRAFQKLCIIRQTQFNTIPGDRKSVSDFM